MSRFRRKRNTWGAGEWIKGITELAFKNDVDIAQERAVGRKKVFMEKDKI